MLRVLLIGLVRLYRGLISPVLPRSCRYTPSCSAYTIEALERHGVWRGLPMAVRRIVSCHPGNPGGYDPVPDASGQRQAYVALDDDIQALLPSLRQLRPNWADLARDPWSPLAMAGKPGFADQPLEGWLRVQSADQAWVLFCEDWLAAFCLSFLSEQTVLIEGQGLSLEQARFSVLAMEPRDLSLYLRPDGRLRLANENDGTSDGEQLSVEAAIALSAALLEVV